MEPEQEVQPVAEEQDTDTGVDSETNDSSEGSDDFQEKYENQKKRAEIAENKLKELKTAISDKPEEGEEKQEVTNTDSDSLKQDVEELKLAKLGYDDEIIPKIMELGGLAALENPIVKKSADDLQSQFNAQQAADIGAGPEGQMKTKFSKEDMQNMSVEELEKVLPHAED